MHNYLGLRFILPISLLLGISFCQPSFVGFESNPLATGDGNLPLPAACALGDLFLCLVGCSPSCNITCPDLDASEIVSSADQNVSAALLLTRKTSSSNLSCSFSPPSASHVESCWCFHAVRHSNGFTADLAIPHLATAAATSSPLPSPTVAPTALSSLIFRAAVFGVGSPSANLSAPDLTYTWDSFLDAAPLALRGGWAVSSSLSNSSAGDWAFTDGGAVALAVALGPVLVPDQVSGVSAEGLVSSATVRWDSLAAQAGDVAYTIHSSPAPSFSSVDEFNTSHLSFAVPLVPPYTRYFRVRGFNYLGDGPWSVTVNASANEEESEFHGRWILMGAGLLGAALLFLAVAGFFLVGKKIKDHAAQMLKRHGEAARAKAGPKTPTTPGTGLGASQMHI